MNEQSAGSTVQATDHLRPGLNSITPYLVARDAAHLIEFLKVAFGGTVRLRVPGPDGSIMHAEVAIGNGGRGEWRKRGLPGRTRRHTPLCGGC